MPDETTTNQETAENTPIFPNSEINMGFDPFNMPSEAPESPRNADMPISLKDANEAINEPNAPSENEGIQTIEPPVESNPEPISELTQTSETRTAQMAGNEPLGSSSASVDEPLKSTSEPLGEPVNTETSESKPNELKSEIPKLTEATPPLAVKNLHDATHENLIKAQLTIQNKKRKKLDLILTLFMKQKSITNDEVEKFLHVSDATATRYLSILEEEGKIKRNGKTGQMVSYSRI